MQRLRFYQLSLRRLMGLTTVFAACLWLALWCLAQITPPHGEMFVPPGEQRLLAQMAAKCGLVFREPSRFK